jgi:2-oxoisovalerate dehydrogenase E1 component
MLLARRFDEKLIELYEAGGPVVELPHSHIGQEAIGVGACYGLRCDDYVLPSLRTRPALLVRGVPAKIMMAGILGKETGPAKAKVTTHHLGDHDHGIVGTTGLIGGHIAAASGVALACKLKKSSSVVLCFFGDGASSQGDFHEASNFAAVKKLPLIQIIEHNMYAMWTRSSNTIPIENLSTRAVAYGFPGVTVDGNDVLAVHNEVQKAIERARAGEGPTLVECKTYRYRSHTERKGIKERRDAEELERWKQKDPILQFRKHLLKIGILDDELEKVSIDVNAEMDEAVKFAEQSPFPKPDEVLEDVYGPPTIQREDIEPELKSSAREVTYGQALNEALREEMMRDERVFLLGEDLNRDAIGLPGGLWPPTRGLCNEFPDRVIGTPISESEIIGAAIGTALVGMRPVAEIMYADFIALAMDPIVNYAAKMRFNYGGKASVPMVVRTPLGAGHSMGLHHSQCPEAWFLNVPGLKIISPSAPYDAKGLLKAAIRDDDPVIFFEHKFLYGVKGPIPEGDYVIPIGKASVKRKGEDVTIIATARMVHEAFSAAERLQEDGVSAEIIDPRTLLPLDKDTILKSVKKTGRVIIVHEAPKTGGFGAEVAAVIAEEALEYLDAAIQRVAAPFTPVPFSPPLENFYLPNVEKIISAVKETISKV